MKDHHTLKLMSVMAERDRAFMSVMAERDRALHEREQALSERKAAFADRDKAFLDLNAAMVEMRKAIVERDEVIAALDNAQKSGFYNNYRSVCPPACAASGGNTKGNQQHSHHLAHAHLLPPHLAADASYDQEGERHVIEASPISTVSENGTRVQQSKKQRKEPRVQAVATKKASKSPRKSKRLGDLAFKYSDDLKVKNEWKDEDLGLNQVIFDESTMPVPVCSCTGDSRPCYKWGSGGWQSSCCTTNLCMYPLPVVPNKRHTRLGGRKMSGSVFNKLLSRLAAEGHDLSTPLDLREHWSKHGTNRYITIR